VDYYIEAILKSAVRRAALILPFIIFRRFWLHRAGALVRCRVAQSGKLTHGELTRFLLYTTFIGGSVASAAEVVGAIDKSLGAASRVMAIKDEVAEVVTVDINAPRLTGAVAFKDLTFAYPSRPDVCVLDGISLEARAGERIALVGPSGAGKSTVVSLLLRFYEPTSGKVMLDGFCAADLSLGLVRTNIALVPQDVVLFGEVFVRISRMEERGHRMQILFGRHSSLAVRSLFQDFQRGMTRL
jgi:ATP-binding cassette subfamily B protein